MSQALKAYAKNFSLTSERTTAKALWIVTFAILTAIGAQIEIPHVPVPYTLQTFFVLLAGAILGKRSGFLSMTLYLLLGVIGFPVFSSGGFGFLKLLGPTGGYLAAFPVAALLIGAGINFRSSLAWTTLWMILGLLVIFLFGTLQLGVVTQRPLEEVFEGGFLIFSWWDLTKLGAAVAISREFQKRKLAV